MARRRQSCIRSLTRMVWFEQSRVAADATAPRVETVPWLPRVSTAAEVVEVNLAGVGE